MLCFLKHLEYYELFGAWKMVARRLERPGLYQVKFGFTVKKTKGKMPGWWNVYNSEKNLY